MKITKQLEATAYHEAGHYVTGVYYISKEEFDIQVDCISIKQSEDILGQVSSDGDGLSTHEVNSDDRVRAVLHKSLAGYASEIHLDPKRPDAPLSAEDDFQYAKWLFELWNPVNETFKHLIGQTQVLVKDLWPGIELVAKELLMKNTISGIQLEILEIKVQNVLGLIDEQRAQEDIEGLESLL